MTKTKVEIEGVGPIWRDPRRNSIQKAVPGVPYGGMATHLVTKRCDLGSLGVPGPASTPKPNLAFSNLHNLYICCIESIYLLYENQIVSSVEKLELLLKGGGNSPRVHPTVCI